MPTQTPTLPAPTDWLTVPEAAAILRTGSRPIYRAIKNGKLRAVAINDRGDLRITPPWLTAWLETRVVHADVDGLG